MSGVIYTYRFAIQSQTYKHTNQIACLLGSEEYHMYNLGLQNSLTSFLKQGALI